MKETDYDIVACNAIYRITTQKWSGKRIANNSLNFPFRRSSSISITRFHTMKLKKEGTNIPYRQCALLVIIRPAILVPNDIVNYFGWRNEFAKSTNSLEKVFPENAISHLKTAIKYLLSHKTSAVIVHLGAYQNHNKIKKPSRCNKLISKKKRFPD